MAMLALAGLPKTVGRPMSNQVSPPFEVEKILPSSELMAISLPSTGLTAKLVIPGSVHWGSGVGKPWDCWSKPNVLPVLLTWKKLVKSPPEPGNKYSSTVPRPCWSTATPLLLRV